MLLARHGQTEWSRDGRYQGRSDAPLNAHGEAQALQLGLHLRGLDIDAILTSPLRRARETAGQVAGLLGLGAPLVDARLVELDYGAWEGLTQCEIRLRWPERLRQWKRAPEWAAAPGGESLGRMRERMRAFFLDPMWATHCGGRVLIVSHSGPIRVALLEAAQRPLGIFRRIVVPTASVHGLCLHRHAASFALATPSTEQKPCILQ